MGVGDDEYLVLRDERYGGLPVAELTDADDGKRRRRGRGPKSRRIAAAVLVGALLAAGVVVAVQATHDSHPTTHRIATKTPRTDAKITPVQARANVLAGLHATTASGSFKIHAQLSEAQGAFADGGQTIVADSTVNVHPTVIVSTSDVGGAGHITSRVNGTDVWETGGGNYGMSPGDVSGPGAPLSQFAGLVMSSLGPHKGAVAMQSLASPTGYLDLAEESITAASWVGAGTVDGVAVQEYQVVVDAAKVTERPGLTPEELKAASASLVLLHDNGYQGTTVELAIDSQGYVRHTLTVVRFADGGAVTADAHLSAFGCSSVEMQPNGPAIVPNPSGCAAGAAGPAGP